MIPVEKILFIDDEVDWHRTVLQFFSDFDIDVATDTNFMDKINKRNYETIILDINMPCKDGKKVYEEIRKFDLRCIVVVLTSLTNDTDEVQWFLGQNIPVYFKSDRSFNRLIKDYMNKFKFKQPTEISILIVDDSCENIKTYSEFFKKAGILDENITSCTSIEEANKEIACNDFDIYLIDICYPEDGKQVCKGHKLIDIIKERKHSSKSIMVPISTREIAKSILDKYKNENNIRPIFYEPSFNFSERIKFLLSRGPFGVEN